MGVGAVIHCCVGDSASRIGAWGVTSTLRPAFYLPRCHYSTPYDNIMQAFFVGKVGFRCPEKGWPATTGQAGGCRGLGAGRGQRCVRSVQSPADGRSKPWEAGPVGIASLVCPAGHGMGISIGCSLSLLLRPFMGLQGRFVLLWNQNKFYLELTNARKNGIIEL